MKLSNRFNNFLEILLIVSISFFIGYFIKILRIEGSVSIQEWFVIIGNIAQALLVVLGLFVFVQIKITKDIFKVQCERDALKKSTDLAYYFANEIIPVMSDYYASLEKSGFTPVNKELSDFCMNDIDVLYHDEKEKCKQDIQFFAENKELRKKCIHVLNNLEALAVNFTKLVADEESLFSAISQAYCTFIERGYPVICLRRKTKHDLYYVNMIDLYKEWSKRIKLNGLMVESKGLNEKVAEIIKTCNNSKYSPKGTKI